MRLIKLLNKSTLDNSPPPLFNLKQGQIIDVKCKNLYKSAIFNFFSVIIELVREIVISNIHNTFGKNT